MKKYIIAAFMLLSLANIGHAAQVALETTTNPAYEGNVTTLQGDDVRLTAEANATKQQAMNTQLFAFTGPWEKDRVYVADQYVTQGDGIYICKTNHTSDVFATDLAAVRWKFWGSDIYALANHNHTGTYEPAKGSDDNFVTDTEKARIGDLEAADNVTFGNITASGGTLRAGVANVTQGALVLHTNTDPIYTFGITPAATPTAIVSVKAPPAMPLADNSLLNFDINGIGGWTDPAVFSPAALATVRTSAGGGSATAPPTEVAVGDALTDKASLGSSSNPTFGTVTATNYISSTTNGAPFTVSSNQVVVNLNASLLDGLGPTDFALEVLDEGTSRDLLVNKINFIGAGVSAVENANHTIDVTISGGGAAVINDLTDVDTTGKATGKVLKFDASGNLIVGDDEIGAAGTGDITGVTAGTGLTGGGDTGAVTVGLSQATQDAIAANTAKVSFDSTSSTRLAGTSGSNTGDQTLPVGGTPALTFGTANSAGSSPNFLRRDDTVLAFDATSPTTQAFGDTAVVGTAGTSARRDHKHAMMAAPTSVSGNAGSLAAQYIDWNSASGGSSIANKPTIPSAASDTAYDATSWDGVTTIPPSKNAVRDYLETKLPSGSDGTYGLLLTNNTARTPTATSNELYPEANVWKANQNGTESSIAIGPTGGQVSFTGPTVPRAYALPDAAATIVTGTAGVAAGNILTLPTDPAAHTLFGFDNTTNTYRTLLIGANLSYDQATNTVSASASSGMTNPMTTLGDIIYGGAAGVATRLAGDTSNTRKFLLSVSTAGVATAPAYSTLALGDLPVIAGYTSGAGTVAATDTILQAIQKLNGNDGLKANAADAVLTGSTQLPNGANPTTDAAGEIAVDTSTGAGQGVRAYGAVGFTLPAYQIKCTTINAAAAASDFMVERFPYAITIRAAHVMQLGATNVIGHLDECDANGANCATIDSTADITATTTMANDDGTLSNPSIDATDVIAWHTTSVSGTNTQLMVCFDYTVDQVN